MQPKIEMLPLSAGTDVPAGQGQLEVLTPDKVVLYVDGVFVGRGPVRRMALEPRAHELVIGEGADRIDARFEIKAGTLTRVALPPPPAR